MKHYTVPTGCITLKHHRISGEILPGHGSPGHPKYELEEVCATHYPAGVCTCGTYLLTWGKP